MTFPGGVGALPGLRTSGPLPLKNDFQASTGKPCVTLHLQEAGKVIFLKEGKASTESVFSGLYLAATVSLLRYQTSRPALRTQIPESGPCVSLYFPSLADTFLGHSGTSHEEAGCGSVSECAILWSPS